MERTLSYQLGEYIGDHIVDNYLPTLDCDGGCSRHPIKVADNEKNTLARLAKIWHDQYSKESTGNSEEWIAYREYAHRLQNKYLPHILECDIYELTNDIDEEDLKKGIQTTLWHSDICSYKIEKLDDIELIKHPVLGQMVKLHLDLYEN